MEPTLATPWTPAIEPVRLPDGYVIRELAPDEWGRLAEAGGDPLTLPPESVARVIVIVSPDDQVVGHCLLTLNVMAEGLHFAPAIRQHAKLGLAFLGAFVTLLAREGVSAVYAMSAAEDPEAAARLTQIGFTPLPVILHRGEFPSGGH